MLKKNAKDLLTVKFDYFLHRPYRIRIWSLLQHLIGYGVQLKGTENNRKIKHEMFFSIKRKTKQDNGPAHFYSISAEPSEEFSTLLMAPLLK